MTNPDPVRSLFDELLTLPGEQRDQILRAHRDASVADRVRELLNGYEQASVLERSPVRHAAAAVEAIPNQIGPYRIEGELGRGGMGVVYLASRADDAYRKTVAVKVVGGGMPIEVFRRERQIMAALDHPNIARMHDGGTTENGALYFVMEYVEGEPLGRFAASLGTRAKLTLFHQICGAVEYAHRHLVVHRDLKPGNILITAEGVVKLLDFGIAKVLDPGLDSATTIQTGMTPRYASPEQLLGKPVTISSDIYSLGVVLFELLSNGVHPFVTPDQSLGSFVDAVLHRDPRRLSQVAPVDRDLEFIAAKAISRETRFRYETVGELRQDIENHLSGLPVRARPASWRYRAMKFAARNRTLVALAAGLAIAVGAGVGATVRAYRVADRERAAAVKAAAEARQLAEQREQMRIQAEGHAAEAARERLRAEASEREALNQRDSANQRLSTAQSLASNVIFDAYDGVRDLPGRVDAKVKIVDKTLSSLENLLRQSPGDAKTIDLLANAYMRAGDISSGAAGEGVDIPGAVKYYRRLVELREQAARFGTPSSLTQLPVARIRLASAMGRLQQIDEAMNGARRAIQEFESLPASVRQTAAGKGTRVTLYDFACEITGFNSLTTAALKYCTLASEFAGAPELDIDPRILMVRGSNWAKLAVLARSNQKAEEASRFLAAAVESYVGYLKVHPDSADAQRGLAIIAGHYAVMQESLGSAEARVAYEKALEALTKIVGVVKNRTQAEQILAWIHMRYATFLYGKGEKASAKENALRSLAIYSARTNGSSPTGVDFNDHSDNLLRCPIPELRNPPEALRLANRAVASVKSPNVFFLDTLANAQYANGQKEEAIATVKEALALLEKRPMPALKAEVEGSLRRFLSSQ